MPTKKQRAKKRAEKPKGKKLALPPKKSRPKRGPTLPVAPKQPNYDADVPDDAA